MSWDEKLFGFFYNKLLKSTQAKNDFETAVHLEDVRRQSEILISALCEFKVEIRDSSGWGGCQNGILFLPEKINYFKEKELNLMYLEWRLLWAHLSILGAENSESSKEVLWNQFPHLKNAFQLMYEKLEKNHIKDNLSFWLGEPPVFNKKDTNQKNLNLNAQQELSARPDMNSKEVKGQTQDRAKITHIKETKDNPLVHVFEKVITAEDYQSGQKKMDGSDEMGEHADALNELRLSHVIRTQASTQTVSKSNAIIDVEESEQNNIEETINEKVFYYPEWFSDRRAYQPNWCTIIEKPISIGSSVLTFDKNSAEKLRSKVESSFSSYQWRTRQKEGPEIDLSLAVDRYVQSQVGGNLSDRIYRAKQKHNHDFAIQILVDSSLSTDSYALGKRIIDTTQEALNIFSFAFEGVLDSISIAAFSSYTRNKVHYSIIKDFTESWEFVPQKISTLKPEGYTRIGPAFRHSRQRLDQLKARKKLLLFISDAKPTDYDFYEGSHGVNDIQRAVTELHASQCKVKVLTLTDKKHSHHNYVFGSEHCRVLKSVQELSATLFEFWYTAVK